MADFEKTCSACGQARSVTDFYKDARSRDGLLSCCKSCHNARVRRWQEKVGDRHLENCRNWKRGNPERMREALKAWRAKNHHRYRDNEREWRSRNSVSVYARNRERTRLQRQATPAWVDRDAIAAVYRQAREMSKETGQRWHVDHVIPLQGKTVSGLHVHYNLRAIPAVVNERKGNRLLEAA